MPTNIIPKTFMKNVYYNIQDIKNDISDEKFYNDNIFEQFKNVNHNYLIIIALSFLIVFYIFRRTNITFNNVISTVVGLFVVYFLFKKNFYEKKDLMKDNEIQKKFIETLLFENNNWYSYDSSEQMTIIPNPSHLYIHNKPELLNFFYDNKDFGQYNLKGYVLSINYCNNIVNLYLTIKENLKNSYQMLELMKMEITKALNAFESIIHTLDNVESIDGKSDELQVLLNDIYVSSIRTVINRNENNDNNIYMKPKSILLGSLTTCPNDTNIIDYNSHYNYYN